MGLLAGYRAKILDGNWLAGREHRLAETRGQTAAPLPGKALLVFGPALEVITDRVPGTDAYTRERALLPAVLERVRPGEPWIADRNFCARGLLWGLHERGAVGLVREREQIRFKPLEAMRVIGDLDGGRVSERRVSIGRPDGSGALEARRLRLQLDAPTRSGDGTPYLLATAPGRGRRRVRSGPPLPRTLDPGESLFAFDGAVAL